MITNLKIQNFTLIDKLDISFGPGFSVITGETGAGKSIILGALSMLLGQRADSKNVKTGESRCVVEAHFDLRGYDLQNFFHSNDLDYDAEDCILRRELTSQGKSRSFVNDTPVPLSLMKELGSMLIDIHSQHQNLLLRDADFQLSVVDILADNVSERKKYAEVYKAYVDSKNKLSQMQNATNESMQQQDFLRFQLEELQNANIVDANELEELEERSLLMSHTEDIKTALYTADECLNADENGVVRSLQKVVSELSSISNVYSDCEELASRLDECLVEIKDVSSDIGRKLDDVDFDPRELDRINDRLDVLNSLVKKHRVQSLAEVIAIRDDISERLSQIDNSDEAIHNQELIVAANLEKATKIAAQLTKQRTKAAKAVEVEMQKSLVPLGIPNVRFKVEITPSVLTEKGADDVAFLFSANTSTDLQPVAQVASGGEIARVMLSLKAMISSAVSMPTIIFDEVDTGVSGKIAEAMGKIMQQMGADGHRQVLAITHLPQIASRGAAHYRVVKTEDASGTKTSMYRLSDEERINELAQMLSGSKITDAAILQAKELLEG